MSQPQSEVDEAQRDEALRERDAARRAEPFEPGQRAFSQFALARAARLDASALAAEPGGLGSALLLLRAAILLLAEARGSSASSLERSLETGASEWGSSDAATYLESALGSLPAEARFDVESVLDASSGGQYIASLDETRQRAVFAGLNELARVLGQPLEAVWAGAKRKALWRGMLWVLAVSILTGAVWKGLVPNNVARHATVSVSSWDRSVKGNPRGLVDGDRKSMGIHTNKGPRQWASIDLGETETINEVRIYNRRDCCQNRAVPLRIEVSSNGADYATVGRREAVFDDWTLTFSPAQARYVKVVNESNNVLHLAEVEVY